MLEFGLWAKKTLNVFPVLASYVRIKSWRNLPSTIKRIEGFFFFLWVISSALHKCANIDVLHQALDSRLLVNCFPDICSPFNVIQYRCIDRDLSHSVSWLACTARVPSEQGRSGWAARKGRCRVYLQCPSALSGWEAVPWLRRDGRCRLCTVQWERSAQTGGPGAGLQKEPKGASGSQVSSLTSVNLDLPAICLGCCEGQDTQWL